MVDEPLALTTHEVAELVHGLTAAIRNEVRHLSEGALRWHPAAGEFCVKEVLGT
jgi:hypothetical protein